MVQSASIVCMIISAVVCFALPFFVFFALRKRLALKFAPLGLGAAAFFLSAFVLEQLLHTAVFGAFPGLRDNIPAYVLYGVLAAGVFEESARYLVFGLLARKWSYPNNIGRPVSYGIGHGGIEVLLLGGLGAVSNLITALLINSGTLQAAIKQLPADVAAQTQSQLQQLASTPAVSFLFIGWERVWALGLQIALSVLVWMVVTRMLRKLWFVGAIGLHAAANVVPALYQTGTVPLWAAELVLPVCVVLIALLVRKLLSAHKFRLVAAETAK